MWAKCDEDDGATKEPIGVRRSLSARLAGARAGDSCSVANLSFASLESANFAARSSMFRGCFCDVVGMLGPSPGPPAPSPGLVADPEVPVDGDEDSVEREVEDLLKEPKALEEGNDVECSSLLLWVRSVKVEEVFPGPRLGLHMFEEEEEEATG